MVLPERRFSSARQRIEILRLLITGGAGFIGKTLVPKLIKSGHEITNFDLVPIDNPEVFNVVGSFDDPYALDHLATPDALIHLAWTSLPATAMDDPVSDASKNVLATIRLFNHWINRGISKIIFLSSGGTVYGSAETRLITERHPTAPIGVYGAAKLAAETYLRALTAQSQTAYVNARVSNPYGPNQTQGRKQGVIPIFLRKVLDGELCEVWGDGTSVRDYIFIEDVATAIMLLTTRPVASGCYNVASSVGVSINDLLLLIEEISGKKANVTRSEPRSFDVQRSVLSTDKIFRAVRWKPDISLREGLLLTLQALKSEPRCLE